MGAIGFGKFNKFYWLILLSALFKILINIFFKVEIQKFMNNDNISILKSPVLNNHIFVRFIYYYFGFVILGSIYVKSLAINKEFFKDQFFKEKFKRALLPTLIVVIIYIIYEMLTFYIDQRNTAFVNFWVLQIFFIHYFLSRREHLKLYSHQKLSFAIILLLSFGINFISSFLRQCEYPNQDPNKLDEHFINKTIIFPPKIRENLIKKLQESIITANEQGNRACSNKYNVFLLDNNFANFIVLAAFGYLIALFLKSYSAVKLKSIINQNFISIDLIITLMGIFGLSLNIILLFISSLIPCGKDDYFSNFCHSVKESDNNDDRTYYFDNFLYYIASIKGDLFPKDNKYRLRKPKDIILEIIFSFIMSIFGFYKMRFDFSIIKELGVFHLLIPEVFYQFMIDCYIIIYKIVSNNIDKTQITQFIFIIISQLFALIGILIYLELIELKFCGLDKNIRKNISLRANEDVEEISETDTLPIRITLFDKNNEDKKDGFIIYL